MYEGVTNRNTRHIVQDLRAKRRHEPSSFQIIRSTRDRTKVENNRIKRKQQNLSYLKKGQLLNEKRSGGDVDGSKDTH